MIKKESKKAQTWEQIFGAIMVALLIVIVVIFVLNIGGLRDKLFGYAGESNVDDIRVQCRTACEFGRVSDYSQAEKAVTLSDKKTKFSATCKQLESPLTAENCYYVSSEGTINRVVVQNPAQCVGKWVATEIPPTCKSKDSTVTFNDINEKECKSIFWSSISVIVVESACNNI